ncbi:citrate synthase [Talaromyces islandicus]|uniref:Citrate synthase n=1 Tax=Talaromyces islandicus TaxID=28573 RepID=A0A0U1LVE9_TALIS|nr:citrate synthase [Talaromyces islandicus]
MSLTTLASKFFPSLSLFFNSFLSKDGTFRLILEKKAIESKSDDRLIVVDSRTNQSYDIPIVDNSVRATDFRYISPVGFGAGPLERFAKGLRILDPGFQNTAVTESQITYVDGVRGTIQYRQYSLEYLLQHHCYEEVAFLLIWGHLPSKEEKLNFQRDLANEAKPSELVANAIKAFPSNTPCYLMIIAGLSAWAASDPTKIPIHAGGELYQGKMDAVNRAAIRTISALWTVVAMVYCHQRGREFTPADPNASLVENMLLMMGVVDENKRPNPQTISILDKLWILYADHELTNSTAALLHVTSTMADPISGVIASAASGSGPLHAGAIDLAYKMFERIGDKNNVPKVIADVKAKKYRLPGYGHRIYKTVDPRVQHLRKMMDELSGNIKDSMHLSVAMEIDRIASQDRYFTSRNLKVNADLYGCLVFSALGFEPEIITALMMVARAGGGIAHWREAMAMTFSASLEAFIGRLLINQRKRDTKLLTRISSVFQSLPPTLVVSSPLGPSPSPLLLEHTPLGGNVFPDLSWTLPSDIDVSQVKEYLLVVEDPDAPLPSPVVHGLYYGLPIEKTSVGPSDFKSAHNYVVTGGFRYGANRKGCIWSGPRPVLAHGVHRYFFQVIALKAKLSVSENTLLRKEWLLQGLKKDNVLAWGEWVGTFERKPE